MKHKWNRSSLFLLLTLVFLYLPIIVVILYSFNANTSKYSFAFTGFSLKNYAQLFQDKSGLFAALKQTLILGGLSCGISVVIGTMGAFGMVRRSTRLSGAIETVSSLPIMLPEIILGMSFLMVFTAVSLKFGMLTLVLAHVTFCIPYSFLVVKGRLANMDPSLPEAARDLGAGPVRAFLTVTLPLILPGILSGAMLAFAMSLDDFVISYFVNGATFTTLPIKIYSSVKTGVSLQINALSTLIIGTVALLVGLSRVANGIRAARHASHVRNAEAKSRREDTF